jgi:hypothetical protein
MGCQHGLPTTFIPEDLELMAYVKDSIPDDVADGRRLPCK